MSFEDRWMEFGSARVPDPPWADVWALVRLGRASGRGLVEVESLLFRWRWTGWRGLNSAWVARPSATVRAGSPGFVRMRAAGQAHGSAG